jgi:hypothetical protein
MAAVVAVAAVTLAGCGGGTKTASSKLKLTGAGSSSTTTTTTTSPETSTTSAGATTLPGAPTTKPATTTPTTAAKPKTTLPTTPAVTTTSQPGTTGGQILQLTSDSQGTFDVAIGQTVELTLSNAGEEWEQLNVSPAGLLTGDPSPSPPANGILAIWTAVAPGTVTITANEFVLCSPMEVCPNVANIVRLFQVKLVIS